MQVRANVPTDFVVERGQGVRSGITPPRRNGSCARTAWPASTAQGQLGITPPQTAKDFVHVSYNPVQAVAGGVERTWRTLETTVYYLGRAW